MLSCVVTVWHVVCVVTVWRCRRVLMTMITAMNVRTVLLGLRLAIAHCQYQAWYVWDTLPDIGYALGAARLATPSLNYNRLDHTWS